MPSPPYGGRPGAGYPVGAPAADIDQPPSWSARGVGAIGQLWRSATAGVEWTPAYLAFLTYIFTITTFRLPLAQPAIIFGLGALLLQRERLRVPPFLWVFTAFLAWCAVGLVQTQYPTTVYNTMIGLGKLGLIVLVGANALRSRAQVRFYLLFVLACFGAYPMRGAMLNFFFGGYTVEGRAIWNGTYENPNDLAAHTLIWMSVATGLLFVERRGFIRFAAFAGLGALTLLLFMTQSRGGILGTAPLILGALALTKGQRGKMIFTGAVVAGLIALFAPDSVWNRLGTLRTADADDRSTLDSSADQRLEIWRVARAIIRENPVFGVGVGAYARTHGVVSSRPGFRATAAGERDTHSTYLNVTAETGFFGAGLFALIIGVTLRQAARVRRMCAAAMPMSVRQLRFLELGLIAFLTAGIFGSFVKISVTYLHLLAVWAMAEAMREDFERSAVRPR